MFLWDFHPMGDGIKLAPKAQNGGYPNGHP